MQEIHSSYLGEGRRHEAPPDVRGRREVALPLLASRRRDGLVQLHLPGICLRAGKSAATERQGSRIAVLDRDSGERSAGKASSRGECLRYNWMAIVARSDTSERYHDHILTLESTFMTELKNFACLPCRVLAGKGRVEENKTRNGLRINLLLIHHNSVIY